jgi:hypothetical protein
MNFRNLSMLTVFVLVSVALAGCGDTKKKEVGKSTQKTSTNGDKEVVDPHDVPMTEAEIDKLKGEHVGTNAA